MTREQLARQIAARDIMEMHDTIDRQTKDIAKKASHDCEESRKLAAAFLKKIRHLLNPFTNEWSKRLDGLAEAYLQLGDEELRALHLLIYGPNNRKVGKAREEAQDKLNAFKDHVREESMPELAQLVAHETAHKVQDMLGNMLAPLMGAEEPQENPQPNLNPSEN